MTCRLPTGIVMRVPLLLAILGAGCGSVAVEKCMAWSLPFDGEFVDIIGRVQTDASNTQRLIMDVEAVGGLNVTNRCLEVLMEDRSRAPELMKAVRAVSGGLRIRVIGYHAFSLRGCAHDPTNLLGDDGIALIASLGSRWWQAISVREWKIVESGN